MVRICYSHLSLFTSHNYMFSILPIDYGLLITLVIYCVYIALERQALETLKSKEEANKHLTFTKTTTAAPAMTSSTHTYTTPRASEPVINLASTPHYPPMTHTSTSSTSSSYRTCHPSDPSAYQHQQLATTTLSQNSDLSSGGPVTSYNAHNTKIQAHNRQQYANTPYLPARPSPVVHPVSPSIVIEDKLKYVSIYLTHSL